MEDIRLRFGRRVRLLRQDRGLTLRQVAAAVDINLSHLSNVERGCYSIGFSRLEALAGALACEVHELFEFDAPLPRPFTWNE